MANNATTGLAGVGAGWDSGLIMFDFMFRGEDPTPAFETFPQLDAFWTALVDQPA